MGLEDLLSIANLWRAFLREQTRQDREEELMAAPETNPTGPASAQRCNNT